MTPSNLKTPWKFSGLIGFSGDLISGYRSMIAKMRAAAIFPSVIFLMAGVSWVKLKPAIRMQKNTMRVSPAVYLLSPGLRPGGHR